MNWELVFVTKLYTEAAILQGRFAENEIPVQVLNKQDSMYNIAIGSYELYVPKLFKEMAEGLLQQSLGN